LAAAAGLAVAAVAGVVEPGLAAAGFAVAVAAAVAGL